MFQLEKKNLTRSSCLVIEEPVSTLHLCHSTLTPGSKVIKITASPR